MFKNFLPDIIINSIYEINEEFLDKHSIKLLLLDIDNTLVPHGKGSTQEVCRWISGLTDKGYKLCLVSNNNKERVDLFNQRINIPAFYKSRKPLGKVYRKVRQEFGFDKKNIAAVGDQLLSDIWGANRFDILTILVSPINSAEPFQIRLKRVLEKFILRFK